MIYRHHFEINQLIFQKLCIVQYCLERGGNPCSQNVGILGWPVPYL